MVRNQVVDYDGGQVVLVEETGNFTKEKFKGLNTHFYDYTLF